MAGSLYARVLRGLDFSGLPFKAGQVDDHTIGLRQDEGAEIGWLVKIQHKPGFFFVKAKAYGFYIESTRI